METMQQPGKENFQRHQVEVFYDYASFLILMTNWPDLVQGRTSQK